MSQFKDIRVAALYQALDPPVIRGLQKSVKPTRYKDVGADILFNLREKLNIQIITPGPAPDPAIQEGWCFPDTEAGILSAIEHGATHIWAVTVLFTTHPLQTGPKLDKYLSTLIVGVQPPVLVEVCEDKEYLNDFLRAQTDVPMPRAWSINDDQDLNKFIHQNSLPFPVVAKPVRGRGSQGVKVCRDSSSLFTHLQETFPESPTVMLEEFLMGEEATVTVMPPSDGHEDYWSLPIVTRFNHIDDVAPYSGVIAVERNSRALSWKEAGLNPTYVQAARDCEKVAKLLKMCAPIRIDIRRFQKDRSSPFALFDVNMKPNLCGPGRLGRDDQASLSGLAASALGWGFPTLLYHILETAQSLGSLRKAECVL